MIGYFYDIESLENVFSLVNFKDDTNTCDIYYLIDNEDELIVDENGNPISETEFLNQMKQRIYDKNKNFKGNRQFVALEDVYNLHPTPPYCRDCSPGSYL